MVATLYICVPLHCYCSVPIDLTLAQPYLAYLVSDANRYRLIGINVKERNMATKCKVTKEMTNKCAYVHICAKLELPTTKTVTTS